MTLYEIVQYLKARTYVTYEDLAKLTNRATGSSLHTQLQGSKNPTLKNIVEIMKAFRYKVIVVPEDQEVENAIVLDGYESGYSHSTKREACPKCGHLLSKKERYYTHCPYCGNKIETIAAQENKIDEEINEADIEASEIEDLDKILG